jgi:hypothetical protein
MVKSSLQKIAGNLTPKQFKGVAALLSSKTIADAALKAQVSERTLFTWLEDADFRAEVRKAEMQTVENATRRLLNGQNLALDTLEDLTTKARGESVRRLAAESWLNLSMRYNEMRDVESRLTELEKAVYGDDKK